MSEQLSQGYLALPSSEQPSPAVLVLHAWWGLNDFFKQFCDRLAQAGFVAFAPDLYGGKVATTIDQAAAYRDDTNWDNAIAQARSAVQALRRHPRVVDQPIGVIGFSLGVFVAFSLVEQVPQEVRAVVLFYGAGEGGYQGWQAAVLGHFAENDAYEDAEYIAEMERLLKAAGLDVTFHTYPGTGHWFFESDQPNSYDVDAAQLAWERTVEFLKARLS